MARLVVIAPGRGTYNRSELNSMARYDAAPNHAQRADLLRRADDLRTQSNRIAISELDSADRFQPQLHLPGENASALIFTCSAADHALIAPSHDIVAVLGNSMGWYSTLYTSGCLSFEDAFRVVDTMGNYQRDRIVGGQLIYPVIDDDWRIDSAEVDRCMKTLGDVAASGEDHWVGLSIRLGGFLVMAGTELGVRALLEALPERQLGANTYPFRLAKHAAFHTPLMTDASRHGLASLSGLAYTQPKVPMIDGRGAFWRPLQSDPQALRDYTFGTQVRETFDFTASVRVAIRETNPDHLVLLGPGETLGGAIAHVIISERWRGITSKADFIAAQKRDDRPLIAMNRADQAAPLWR